MSRPCVYIDIHLLLGAIFSNLTCPLSNLQVNLGFPEPSDVAAELSSNSIRLWRPVIGTYPCFFTLMTVGSRSSSTSALLSMLPMSTDLFRCRTRSGRIFLSWPFKIWLSYCLFWSSRSAPHFPDLMDCMLGTYLSIRPPLTGVIMRSLEGLLPKIWFIVE